MQFTRGITTGLNDAFIIDNQTKEALVAQDPKAAEEIIKPVLRGKDIQRFRAKWKPTCGLSATFHCTTVSTIDMYPADKH